MSSEMILVVSRQIESIGFDAATNTLYVRFLGKTGPGSGSLYAYFNRSAAEFDEFKKAPSKYKWFAKNVKPTKDYKKIG